MWKPKLLQPCAINSGFWRPGVCQSPSSDRLRCMKDGNKTAITKNQSAISLQLNWGQVGNYTHSVCDNDIIIN